MEKYNYKIENDIVIIQITNKKKQIFYFMIDKEDLEKVINFKYKWHVNYNKHIDGYYVSSNVYLGMFNGKPKYKTLLLHNFLINKELNERIDHIDHDTLNNCKSNLRVTTNSNNNKHRRSKNINNTSGYRNISFNKKTEKFLVQLQVDGKNTCLGKFINIQDAIELSQKMRDKYYKEFCGEN